MTNPGRRTSALVAQRELARLLVDLRKRANLKVEHVSKALAERGVRGLSRTMLFDIEAHKRKPGRAALEGLLELYGATDEATTEALALVEQAGEAGWWDQPVYEKGLSPTTRHFAGLEWGCRRLRAWSGSMVDSLLQTPEYTEAVLAADDTPRSSEQVATIVGSRQLRQAVLDHPDPLDYDVLMSEGALLTPAGTPRVMAAQLHHIAEIVDTHANVTVRVVPFRSGIYPATVPSFTIMTFQDSGHTVYMEPALATSDYLDEPDDLNLYSRVFDRLTGMALDVDATLDLLQSASGRWAKEVPTS